MKRTQITKSPVNWGATVPRVNLENLREDNITGLYCSSTGSTDALISSDAAYKTNKLTLITISPTQNEENQAKNTSLT